MSRCCSCGNTWKLVVILIISFTYFLAELIVGTWIKSLSLVADSFHMFSDVLSIIIGIIAIRVAKMPRSAANTFGWQRAEVFGSLVNCVSLVTLCFTILVSAAQRLVLTDTVGDTFLMLIVGTGGLVVNIIGIIIINPFCGSHGHSHGHSHGISSSKSVKRPYKGRVEQIENAPINDESIDEASEHPETLAVQIFTSMKTNSLPRTMSSQLEGTELKKEGLSMNMRAVLLHIAADFIGSVVVCISAVILRYGPEKYNSNKGEYKLYVDPVMSILMVAIILCPTFSLLKQVSLILLQSVPSEINIKELLEELHKIDSVTNIHDLHIWRLRPNVIIGTTHVKVNSIDEYNLISNEIKQIFHHYDIHCTTIQPEFQDRTMQSKVNNQCDITCNPKDNCQPNECCTEDKKK